MFPGLHQLIRDILVSDPTDVVQFVLEPLAYPSILADFQTHGEHFRHLLSYLTRTFAFSLHRQYQKLITPPVQTALSSIEKHTKTYVSGTEGDTAHSTQPGQGYVDPAVPSTDLSSLTPYQLQLAAQSDSIAIPSINNSLVYYPYQTRDHGGRYGGGALAGSVWQNAIPYHCRGVHGEEGGAGEAVHGSGSDACYQQSVSKYSNGSIPSVIPVSASYCSAVSTSLVLE